MVALKCPKCGKSAELPDGLAAGDHRCFSCNVYLQYADPSFIPNQKKEFKDQVYASILGAMLGACSILSVSAFGGNLGIAVAVGAAGALLGCVSGFVSGMIDGVEWTVLMWDGSWFTFMVKVNMVLGLIGGFCWGIFGELKDEWGRGTVVGVGVLGGFVLGGLLGALIGKRSHSNNNRYCFWVR